jgi:nitrite reductase/ring-hydroxylating ferredoxin subunit
MATLITSTDEFPDNGSYLFTVQEADGSLEEVILVSLADGVSAWKNFCQHEAPYHVDRLTPSGSLPLARWIFNASMC